MIQNYNNNFPQFSVPISNFFTSQSTDESYCQAGSKNGFETKTDSDVSRI